VILWRTRETPRVPEDIPEILARRWVVEINRWNIGRWLDIKWRDTGWRQVGCFYHSISLTRHFHLGRESIQYDGWHNSISLGFLHLCWWAGSPFKGFEEE